MKMAPSVQSPRIRIEKLSSLEIDLDVYVGWLRNTTDNKFIEGVRSDYSVSELEQYLGEKLQKPDVMFWGILLETGEFIGTVKLEPIDFVGRSAWLGILIGSTEHHGKGYGSQVIELVSKYASSHLNLDCLYLGVHQDNLGAIKLYESAGFRVFETQGKSLWMKKML